MTSNGFARDWKFWTLAALGTLCALLTAFNFLLDADIRTLQTNVATRQQFINESVPLARVNSQIIQTLANMSAQSNDAAIRDMLARHGVTFSITEPGPPQPDQAE
ncbi:MAG: hypothetical protein KJO01_10365 [Gammaproteobacteria bacterium]|nr:hypothetical protein [Gammaproteobacteria bacterium]MBT8111491.1 hypothetical protein [Gammaproteobacteria bacterium]NND47744.1 hypothetical protein [Woeseiaceae bacterium]NNL46189.1 hypothetical protein [Woeseiaceae bacterium]